MAPQYELAVGLKKGHRVTKLQKRERPSRRRGVSSTEFSRWELVSATSVLATTWLSSVNAL